MLCDKELQCICYQIRNHFITSIIKKLCNNTYTKIYKHPLVDRPPFRPAIGPGSFQNRDQCLHRPRNGPGSSGKGNGPGSCGTTVPVFATNRDQCSGDQHVAHCEALVPVCGNNRDLCPGYISPLASTLLKKFQDCVWVGWVLEFFL